MVDTEILKEDHNAQKDMRQIRGFFRITLGFALFCLALSIPIIFLIGPHAHGDEVRDYHVLLASVILASSTLTFLAWFNRNKRSETIAWVILAIEGFTGFWLMFVGNIIFFALTEKYALPRMVYYLSIYVFPPLLVTAMLSLQVPWVRAHSRLKYNTAAPEDKNPWVRYYPVLAQLMIRVMNSDGSMNTKELQHFEAAMDEWHLAKLQKSALRDFCDESTEPLPSLLQRAVDLGRAFGQSNPAQALMTRLEAAASVDGPISDDERLFLDLVQKNLDEIQSQNADRTQ